MRLIVFVFLVRCRYRELQEKLDCLQKNSVQRDRTEALLKQKEKDFAQVSKHGDGIF